MATAAGTFDAEIRQRAYELYVHRGRTPGHELDDWVRAEHEVRQRTSRAETRDRPLADGQDWVVAARSRSNVLLVGSQTLLAVETLLPTAPGERVTVWRPGDRLVLPSTREPGTLVLRDVEQLTRDDQARLLAWLADAARARVISTTPVNLHLLVESGAFDDVLYYRLNVMCCTVPGSSGRPVPAAGD